MERYVQTRLSDREARILKHYLITGKTSRDLGQDLGLTVRQIDNAINIILAKTGYGTRLGLRYRAKELGLINECPYSR